MIAAGSNFAFKIAAKLLGKKTMVTVAYTLGPTIKFYRRLYMKRCVLCHFLARVTKFNNV